MHRDVRVQRFKRGRPWNTEAEAADGARANRLDRVAGQYSV